jgi:hypothetical protein
MEHIRYHFLFMNVDTISALEGYVMCTQNQAYAYFV